MTMTQRRMRGAATLTANPSQGVRIHRAATPLRRTEAGRIALPLTVGNNGTPLGDAELVLTYDDAAELYAELGRMLVDAILTADGTDHE
ncbi:hypothetical protein ACFVZR_02300 [Streptomyces sp. NPDC058316]|uniref:hypothetical protein n=1 Tax=Streptomyces sp. NPDC058316 TaxID=3346442 RepID=UPI0036E52A44